MEPRTPKLRTILSAITIGVAALAVMVAIALVALTTYLHRTNDFLASAVESLRLLQASQIDLLLHGRASDDLVRRELESNIRRRLSTAREFVTTQAEADSLEHAEKSVGAYVAARPEEGTALLLSAYQALESVVAVNLAQSQREQKEAARWDQIANIVGVGTGLLVATVAGLLVWWLNQRAFREVLEIARAMEAFGAGERSARAVESGASELREMARRFNEMATAIANQHDAQIAFVAGVAHDLRNPVTSLRMSVALVRQNKPLPSEDRIRRTLDLVDRQATRLERMIGDFLDAARIEARKLELQLESRDLRALVRDVVDLFAAISGKRVLVVSLPNEELAIRCDPLRIEQVVSNLVSNAIKYSTDLVEISVRRSDPWATIEVKDHGIGISTEDRNCLFEPFRRVGLSRESIPGVGLGLFVVREIVRAHRGYLEVESELHVGSTFRVHLPLPASEPRSRSEVDSPTFQHG